MNEELENWLEYMRPLLKRNRGQLCQEIRVRTQTRCYVQNHTRLCPIASGVTDPENACLAGRVSVELLLRRLRTFMVQRRLDRFLGEEGLKAGKLIQEAREDASAGRWGKVCDVANRLGKSSCNLACPLRTPPGSESCEVDHLSPNQVVDTLTDYWISRGKPKLVQLTFWGETR